MSTFSGPFNRQTEMLDRIADAITGTDELDRPKGNRALDSLERLAIWFESHGGIPTSSGGVSSIRSGTTAEWNSKPALIAEESSLYIYSDYQTLTDKDGIVTVYPNIKIGDGVSKLSSLPFLVSGSVSNVPIEEMTDLVEQRLEAQGRLVSQLDRERWDQIGNVNLLLEVI